jgi:hypothetical protein
MERRKRKLLSRIKHIIKRWLGFYKLHYKTIKNGCPRCGADLITCEIAVTCSNYERIKIDKNTGKVTTICDYQIIAG